MCGWPIAVKIVRKTLDFVVVGEEKARPSRLLF
jgi:hypothetical protein